MWLRERARGGGGVAAPRAGGGVLVVRAVVRAVAAGGGGRGAGAGGTAAARGAEEADDGGRGTAGLRATRAELGPNAREQEAVEERTETGRKAMARMDSQVPEWAADGPRETGRGGRAGRSGATQRVWRGSPGSSRRLARTVKTDSQPVG